MINLPLHLLHLERYSMMLLLPWSCQEKLPRRKMLSSIQDEEHLYRFHTLSDQKGGRVSCTDSEVRSKNRTKANDYSLIKWKAKQPLGTEMQGRVVTGGGLLPRGYCICSGFHLFRLEIQTITQMTGSAAKVAHETHCVHSFGFHVHGSEAHVKWVCCCPFSMVMGCSGLSEWGQNSASQWMWQTDYSKLQCLLKTIYFHEIVCKPREKFTCKACLLAVDLGFSDWNTYNQVWEACP